MDVFSELIQYRITLWGTKKSSAEPWGRMIEVVSSELPMIYILRLTNGECVVAMAIDESNAREQARELCLDETAEVATIRRLDRFAAQFTPVEDGTLTVTHWDDSTLDGILAHEYPFLYQAFQRANVEPLLPTVNPAESVVSQLKAAYERNTDIIRQGLHQELQTPSQPIDS